MSISDIILLILRACRYESCPGRELTRKRALRLCGRGAGLGSFTSPAIATEADANFGHRPALFAFSARDSAVACGKESSPVQPIPLPTFQITLTKFVFLLEEDRRIPYETACVNITPQAHFGPALDP
jgi:hypothetical protein